MNIFNLLAHITLGLGIGFATGLTGIGAAVLIVPSLIYVIKLSPVTAIGTGLFYSMLMKSYASFEHIRLHNVLKQTALYISLGSIPAVIITSFFITRLEKTVGHDFDFAIKIAICIVMIITWCMMLINTLRSHRIQSGEYYAPQKEFPLRRKIYSIITGVGLGTLVGATSIGGGVFLIPILATLFKVSPSNTVGTSTLISVIISAIASFVYFFAGNINLYSAFIMFIGSIPGVWLGCRLSVKTPPRLLTFILFAVITISIVVMFLATIK